ncbi:lysoplasmalogenase family protein [Sphingomonas baiyangensis]|uniref:Lysoplasmalogenase n=1 Tax=Sphingomonas baiyangensis TaxID=2572576 RepID=A0A4U1L263_9SPHN|nr:lysoplasmalogenase family protein [Sphingomonas baiyangensis]TKD50692.1 lysoplasmalogenase [Sphingomonas baiyangensis]
MDKSGDGGAGLYWAAVAIGASYSLAAWAEIDGWAVIAWKGAGVGLLALWAARRATSRDGWILAAMLALGATGDVLLDAIGFVAGGIAFALGHLLAIALFARHRRPSISASQRLLGWLLPFGTTATAALLTRDALVVLYAAILGSMAGLAWTSAFARYRVGLGAVLFVASDLLIFARGGALAQSALPTLLVWPLYLAAQALIARGVVDRLAIGRTATISVR